MTDEEKVVTIGCLTHCERCHASACIPAALSVKPLGHGHSIGNGAELEIHKVEGWNLELWYGLRTLAP